MGNRKRQSSLAASALPPLELAFVVWWVENGFCLEQQLSLGGISRSPLPQLLPV